MDSEDFMGRPQIVDINNIYDKEEDSTAPDKALIVAVLERAIRDLEGVKGTSLGHIDTINALQNHRRSAIQWFLESNVEEEDYESSFTLEYCCLVLDINKEMLKQKVFERM
jgi:hypothetical protein